jgi:hypothetical protein
MAEDRSSSPKSRPERSYKPEIVRRLFEKRWNQHTRTLANPIVLGDEIRQEHANYRASRGERQEVTNVYAFMKDLLRSNKRNSSWPREVFEAGYTGRQVTGEGRVFEFIPVLAGQTEPFPTTIPAPPAEMIPHQIGSVSMPLASRRLGRNDEPWLVQVSVRLRVIGTYFALFSSRKAEIRQVDHLQNALKLRRTEIDALFLGVEEPSPNDYREFLITCEAKGRGQDIIVEQVLQQAKAVFQLQNVTQNFVIPVALKSMSASRLHLVEFAPVTRAEADSIEGIAIVNQALFDFVPAIPGM